ncbi:MAG: DUF3667 domain-containing protein [Sphingobacteriales bacterium]|nr:MAG: DUF3667 domain-containing protein [Sphingobacteriales bacterium]
MSTHTCPNCSNQFTGQFCNNCGQKVVHRLTMPHLWHDLIHAFTHTDKGFFYLMGQLFVRPGVVAREYIVEGKRKRYFLPLQYLIILSAIATIIVSNSHYIEETMKTMSALTGSTGKYPPGQAAFMEKLNTWQSKYYNIMILLQLPFYALAASIFYNSRHKYNYAEFLTLQTFVTGQTTLISMVLMLFLFISKASFAYLSGFMLFASLAYQIWVYMNFFQEKNVTGFFKALGSYILGVIFFILLGMLIGILIMLYALIFR